MRAITPGYPFRPRGKERGGLTLARPAPVCIGTTRPLPPPASSRPAGGVLILLDQDGTTIRQASDNLSDPLGSHLCPAECGGASWIRFFVRCSRFLSNPGWNVPYLSPFAAVRRFVSQVSGSRQTAWVWLCRHVRPALLFAPTGRTLERPLEKTGAFFFPELARALWVSQRANG